MKRTGRQIDLNQRKLSQAQSEEISSYIFFTSLITNLVPDYYSVSLLISRSLSLIASVFFYTLSTFRLNPPRAGQMVGVNTCLINTFLKSLRSSCKAENHCSGITSTLMQPKVQLQSIQCGDKSFLLRYFKTSSSPMFL